MSKVCTKCGEEKPETEFYKYNRKCKKCHNKIRSDLHKRTYIRETMSKHDLTDETKAKIKEDIDNGMKLKIVAEKYGIKYPTLCYWNRNGDL